MIKAITSKGNKKRGRPANKDAKWRKIYAMIEADNALMAISCQKLARLYSEKTGDTCDPVTAHKAQVTWEKNNP